ncbi:integral membrane protein [Aspergillus campestris IBT 28561]|uniref:Integral membrane protein n=1 Tax=Aspergillus campestris (strain IBT 28561) TaxID=1392248 RepID=A0A2I1D2X2_ASPC2|nr:uncharacterized protein P168DRAFT_290310 [Aspergillus campestris IBT 28561]PKY04220.1 integral membrane protein [Aspergillus campestris IBT 28561]
MANATNNAPGNGITGGYDGEELGMKIAIATMAGITWYNAMELIILVFVTFSQYRGLYFWSLLVTSSLGLLPYSVGFLLKFFKLIESQVWLPVTLLTIGWWCMVTGQSVVLYSRLHLVMPTRRILRPVLAMIIIDAIILHFPTTVLTYGTNMAPDPGRYHYTTGYNIMEKIQMTGFCIQEFILSGLYIWETTRMLRFDPDKSKRKIMYQLVIINFIIIAMDVALLAVEFKNQYIMETMIKGVVYSVKLKLEFAVLGKLVILVRSRIWKAESITQHPCDFPDFVDATRVTSDMTHAAPTTRRRSHPWMDPDDMSIAIFEHSTTTNDHESGLSERSRSESNSSQTRTDHPTYPCGLNPIDYAYPLGEQKCMPSKDSSESPA